MSDNSKRISLTSGLKNLFLRNESFLLILILIVSVVVEVVSSGKFFQFGNLRDLVMNNAFTGIVAMGVLVVLISGGIDLSFMANAMIGQYLMSLLILEYPNQTNLLVCFIATCIVGVVLGAANGVLVYLLKVPSMIVTIATMEIMSGTFRWATGSMLLFGLPMWFSITGNPLGKLLPIGMLGVAIVLTWFMLKYTRMGRHIYAYGGNADAARRIGISELKVIMFTYCFMGFMAGLGAPGQMYIVRTFSPSTLVGTELNVLAAVIIGGASLSGGKGTLLGTVFGVLLLGIISNGLVLMGVSSYIFELITGIIIFLSLVFSYISSSTRKELILEQRQQSALNSNARGVNE